MIILFIYEGSEAFMRNGYFLLFEFLYGYIYCSFLTEINELLVVNEIDMVMNVHDSLWK